MRGSARTGARNRLPDGVPATGSLRSVTRRSIGMCGKTRRTAARCTRICAAPGSSCASGMGRTIPEGGWPGSGRLPRVPSAPRTAHAMATGNATRCSGTAKAARAFSRSSNANPGTPSLRKLTRRSGRYVDARAKQLIARQPRPMRTITVDNGTEFHADKPLEAQVSAQFYFATPHHAWERGTNKKTNGLICQYLPKRMRMEHLPQAACTRIATKLNRRPRKRLGYRTPEECYAP